MILPFTTRRGLAYLFTARSAADASAAKACGKVEFQIDARCWTVRLGPFYLATPASDAGQLRHLPPQSVSSS